MITDELAIMFAKYGKAWALPACAFGFLWLLSAIDWIKERRQARREKEALKKKIRKERKRMGK